MRALFVLLVWCLAEVGLQSVVVRAAPPAGSDPHSPLAEWYRGLTQPGSDVSCCSIADFRPVEYRLTPTGYEAWVGDAWISIPDDKVIHHHDNPTGRGVLCRSTSGVIRVVVPAGTSARIAKPSPSRQGKGAVKRSRLLPRS